MGFWTRPLAFLEGCRARYGSRFTLRLLASPPFVILSDPDEIKQVFTAPPDVLHPGEGARVLAPVVGQNSVILLDEDAHMEQRKLMLPAFHGERIERLSDLVAAVAEREVAAWPDHGSVELHPLLQSLTLEVVLRAVFGLDPGPRLDAVRERLSAMLSFGDRFISLIPPPPGGRAEKVLERVGPFAAFARIQREADALVFELIDERRGAAERRGDVLAMLEMKLVLTALLRARTLRIVSEPSERPRRRNITITPGQGSVARLPRRDPPRAPTSEPERADLVPSSS